MELSGYLPSDSLKSFATVRAGTVSRDTTAIASGEPAAFADDLLAALDALSHLSDGKASFDGSKWHLRGDIAGTADGDAAIAALKKGSKGGALWDSSLAGYPPPPSSSERAPAEQLASGPRYHLAHTIVRSELRRSIIIRSSVQRGRRPRIVGELRRAASSSAATEPSSSEPPAQDRDIAPTALEAIPPMPGTLVFEATLKSGRADRAQGIGACRRDRRLFRRRRGQRENRWIGACIGAARRLHCQRHDGAAGAGRTQRGPPRLRRHALVAAGQGRAIGQG